MHQENEFNSGIDRDDVAASAGFYRPEAAVAPVEHER